MDVYGHWIVSVAEACDESFTEYICDHMMTNHGKYHGTIAT